jgi:hypothetical protein
MVTTPTVKKVTASSLMVASAVGGGLASNAVVSMVNYGTLKIRRFILFLVSIVGASAITEKGPIGQIAQGALVGMAITQGSELVIDLIKKPAAEVEGQAGNFLNKIVSRGMASSLGTNYAQTLRVAGTPQSTMQGFRRPVSASMTFAELSQA